MITAFITAFIVISIIITAFKKNKKDEIITKKDKDGNIIQEHHVTEYHSADQIAARIVVVVALILFLAVAILIAVLLFKNT